MSAFIDEHRERVRGRADLPRVADRPVDVLRRQAHATPRRARGRCATASCWRRSGASTTPRAGSTARARCGGSCRPRASRVARCTVERLMRQAGLAGVVRGKPRRTTIPDERADRPTRSGRARLHRDRAQSLVGGGLHVRGDLVGRGLRRVRHRRVLAAGSSAGRPTPRCAPSLVLDTLEMALWTRERAGLPAGAGLIHHNDAGSQYLSFAFTQRLIDAGVDASVGSVGDALRQRPGRDHDRPVQDREDPPRRTLEDARRRRAGHAGMGRLVQQRPTALCLRQTLPSAVRAQYLQALQTQ